VAALREEWILFTIALGKSLADAVASWCIYLAVEPYARRLHARYLISWNRLLRGRFRDPLVGRDILSGVALATVTILCFAQLPIVLPHALSHSEPPAPMFHPLGNMPYLYFLNAPPPQTLLGGRFIAEAFADVAVTAFGAMLVFLIVLLGLHLLIRRLWLALVVNAVLIILISPAAEAANYSTISIICSLILVIVLGFALRFGLVGSLTQWFSLLLWMNFPVAANVEAPHFATGLAAVVSIGALATFGAVTSVGRRARTV
jgi:hypothetical protein